MKYYRQNYIKYIKKDGNLKKIYITIIIEIREN